MLKTGQISFVISSVSDIPTIHYLIFGWEGLYKYHLESRKVDRQEVWDFEMNLKEV